MGYEMLPLAPHALEQAGEAVEAIKQNSGSFNCPKQYDSEVFAGGLLVGWASLLLGKFVFFGLNKIADIADALKDKKS